MSTEEKMGFLSKREVSENMIKRVEAFGEENENERRLAFYKSPRIRQFWGEEQEELESWKEIFFDLIYVAIAFQLGKVLEELIEEDGGSQSGVYFLAQLFPLYTHWQMRMFYLSRFNPTSYFHGIVDVIYATLIALMALFIGKRSEIEATIGGGFDVGDKLENVSFLAFLLAEEEEKKELGFNIALAFTCCSVLATLIPLCRAIETIFVVRNFGVREDIEDEKKKKEREAALNSGRWDLFRASMYLCFISLAAVGAYIGNENLFISALYLGFFLTLTFFFVFVLVRDILGFKRQLLVPVNVGFAIKRLGEFTMLMLGEGVLQIIITDIGEDLDGHLKTFILSFILLACLYAVAFYALPYEPDESAFRKSSISALIIGFIKPLEYATLIGVGVSLKLILKKQDELAKKNDERESLSIFLTFSVLWFLLDRMLNHGYWEITKRDHSVEGRKDKSWSNVNFPRIFFSLLWCATPFSFRILTFLELDGPEFLLVALALMALCALFGIAEYKLFLKEIEINVEEENLKIDIEDKAAIVVSNRVKSSIDGRSSSIRSGKKGGCKLGSTLQFLRKTTRIIDSEVKRACQNDDFDNFDWRKEVHNLEKLVTIVHETFEGYEKCRLEKAANI